MPPLIVREGEPFEGDLRCFKKECDKTAIFSEMERREYTKNPA
jgi:ribosomal protein S21